MTFAIQPASAFSPNTVGAWSGVPMEVYHASPGESNSGLALLARSPLRYRMSKDGLLPNPEPTKDQILGTMIHSVVNEGIEPAYHLRPDTYGPENKKWTMSANVCKEWVAARQDKPILDSYEALMLNSVAGCVQQNPKAMRLLKGATMEVSACAYNPELSLTALLRVRFDVLNSDDQGYFWVETKSTRDASTFAFQREILKRGYHAQCALYRRVLERLTGEKARCYIMAIEKDATVPRVNVRQLTKAAMDLGDKIIDERLKMLKQCKLGNYWPALPDEEQNETIQMIDLPEWCYSDVDQLAGMTEVTADEE